MNKGIGLALVILITPLVVITASTLTFYLGYKPTSTSNNGELIVPPLETNLFKLENINGDSFSFRKGKWYLVYFDNFNDLEASEEKLKFAFSINTTLGRKMNRLKRVVVLREDFNSKSINNLSVKFPNVFFVKDIDREFEDLLLNAGMSPFENQSLFLLDIPLRIALSTNEKPSANLLAIFPKPIIPQLILFILKIFRYYIVIQI